MTYEESVRYLYSLGNEIHTAKLGLERITALLHALGNPHRDGRFIHVAGTNGKGSTCAMIEAGLRASGLRTGLYTSPHLNEPTERIRIDGAPISQAQFAAAFEVVHTTAERMLRAGTLDLHPTYFETVTAMAFVAFRNARVDEVVLETGLGGRLDATNVVSPNLCVITPIDLDHQQFLGDTIEQIAAEKAGILKPGVPAVFSRQLPAAAGVLRSHAQGPCTWTEDWPVSNLEMDARGSSFELSRPLPDGRGSVTAGSVARDAFTEPRASASGPITLHITCPLAGEHQVENARTAALALRELGISPAGTAATEWPGRLEQVSTSPEIILDGAHNPAGVRALVEYIRRFYAGRKIWLVYGVMRDKAVAEMAHILFPLAHRVILTMPANSRAMPPEMIPAPGGVIMHDVAEAVALATLEAQAQPRAAVFITGSLFVVGEARALLVQ